MENLLKTPLFDIHNECGAIMVDFAGWGMPVQYRSIIEEHNHTRQKASLFDTSHMGELEVTGRGAIEYLQYLLTNDIEKLKPGKCFYSAMCYNNGCTIDDCFIYMFSEEKFWVVVNASNTDKDFRWLRENSGPYDVEINNISEKIAKLDLQGPLAEKILVNVLKNDSTELKRFEFKSATIPEYPEMDLFVSRTGYTGEDGFEIYFTAKSAPDVWRLLMEKGAEYELKPAGLGARNTLRLESCYSLYDHELQDIITPVEASVGWVVREYKRNFIGKQVLLEQKKQGTPNILMAFEMIERGIPRMHHKIYYKGEEAGLVTSGTFSPTLKKSIGLGYIKSQYSAIGNNIEIEIRNKRLKAIIVKKPFYQYQGGKGNG